MSNFEPFLKTSNDPRAFSASLEARVQEAVDHPIPETERLQFDTFGLTLLGFAVSGELARVVSTSDRGFMNCSPRANKHVIKWLERGNASFNGDFPQDFFGPVVDPFRELVLPVQEEAIMIAQNCMSNGSGSVMDANLITRSILGIPEVAEADVSTKTATLRNSHKLVARLAMLNDMDPDRQGRGAFNEAVGIEHQFLGAIAVQNLEYCEEADVVDLGKEAREALKQCSVLGRGCPALRIVVEYRGRNIPMIEAFWDGSVDVVASRLSQA
jgi:hypothetical protein